MNKFAQAFKTARLNSDRTFREIANHLGKSIGYVSDIESGRKNPPDRHLVEKIENFLGIRDGHLRKLADDVRLNVPKHLKSLVTDKPQLGEFLRLGETLLREDKLFEQKLEEYISDMRQRIAAGKLDDREGGRLLFDFLWENHPKYSGLGVDIYE